MPSEIMDQRSLSPSSYFYDEIPFPAERQVGFWNPETMHDHHGGMFTLFSHQCCLASGVGMDGKSRTLGSKSITPSPLEQKARLSLERQVVGAERTTNPSIPSWRFIDHDLGTKSNMLVQPTSYSVESNKVDMESQYENGLFSSSLSEIFSKNLRLSSNDVLFGQSVDAMTSQYEDEEPFKSLEEIEAHTIGDLLPDDDDLLFGVIDGLDYIAQPNGGDNIEDFDLFSSGGGMELEGDDSLSYYVGQNDTDISGGLSNGQLGELNSSITGEHPYGEHPSRTLFVRNINSNVEDSELKVLFEQYGDIRTLYTACKHRGFVMISYYDIRAARNAMKALQNKPLRRRKLDIHYSIPKDNLSEKDINQGTLVVFNLDSSVSNDDICQIFGVYGEIKEIRETPHKHHHKFIEFYDVRAAESALRALNRSDIAGKRIKLEASRPGGARRLMQQFPSELEQEESSAYRQQESSPINSPSVGFGPVSHGAITTSCIENGAFQGVQSAVGVPISSIMEKSFHHGISSSVPQSLPSTARIAPVVNNSGLAEPHHALGQMEFGFQRMPTFYPHSLPEYHDGLAGGVPYNSPGSMTANINPRPSGAIDSRHIRRVGLNAHSIELNEGGFGSSGNGSCPLHGPHYVWSNSNSFNHHPPMMWPNSPSFVNGVHAHPPPSPQLHGLPRAPSHMLTTVIPRNHHHVGSAPSINPSLWDRRHVYARESHEASDFHAGSLGSRGFSGSSPLHHLDLTSHNIFPRVGGNCMDTSSASTNVGLHSPQQRCHMVHGRNPMIPMPHLFYGSNEQVRSRRSDISTNPADNKKQYELDIDRILRGEDTRTTLMIKNIPNKYTSKMLLTAIDERHQGTYDFIYLPIDFKNKCNVGYAFINMINPLHIIPFYQAFNGKKWEKFNSEKVASLAYARIQGKSALIAHFQNSSLMNEDKRCRPILFHSDGPNAGDQEPFPMGVNIRSRTGKSQTNGSEENHQEGPSISANGEESSNGMDGSSKDSE